jgi:hypothetical protein
MSISNLITTLVLASVNALGNLIPAWDMSACYLSWQPCCGLLQTCSLQITFSLATLAVTTISPPDQNNAAYLTMPLLVVVAAAAAAACRAEARLPLVLQQRFRLGEASYDAGLGTRVYHHAFENVDMDHHSRSQQAQRSESKKG